MLAQVSGGIIPNVTRFVQYTITSYFGSVSNDTTIRDSYPYDKSKIIAPLVTFEWSSIIIRPIEVGSDARLHRLSYSLDVIGRTKTERNSLIDDLILAFENSYDLVSGYGTIYNEAIGFLADTEYEMATASYFGSTLDLRINFEDFS